jgi:hypothetical protein
MNSLDRQWAGQQTTSVIGPLALPALEDLRAAFVELAALGGRTRAGWTFDARQRRWAFDPGHLRELAVQVVRAGDDPVLLEDDVDPSEVFAAAERLTAARDIGLLPLTVTHSGDLLVWSQSHALGDAQLLLGLTSALVGLAATGRMPKWVGTDPSAHPLMDAARNAFSGNDGKLWRLLRERLADRRGRDSRPTSDGATIPWHPDMGRAFTVFSRASWDSVQHWRRVNAPDSSMTSAYLLLMRLALREAGVRLAPETLTLYDCRRQLPRGVTTRGNFVVGLSQRLPDDAAQVGELINTTYMSERPLATMMVSTAKRRFLSASPPRSVASSPAIVPAFAFAPRTRDVELMPWRQKALRCFAASTTPASPDAITLTMMVVGGRPSATWSFHRNVVDEQAMRHCLYLMGEEPIRLLDSTLR